MAWRNMASFLSFWKFRNTSQRRTGEVKLGTHTIQSHGTTLAWNHCYDWLILLLLAVIEVVVYVTGPFHRFVGKDMMTDLKYPMKDNTVPVWSVPMYAVLLPIAIFLLFYIRRKDVYDLHHGILGLLFAVLITAVITDSIKNAVGRPRPDFFYRCFPDGKDLYDVWGGVVCHGEHGVIKEGHKSFPSGHTSWSFAGLGFLSLYLSGKLKVFDRRGHVAKLCIVFFPLLVASLIGVSRVNDYWHHWQDVFAGGVLGLAVAAFCYRQFFPPPYDDEGWGPYAYFQALKESSANTDTFHETNVQNVQAAEIEIVNQQAGQHDVAAFYRGRLRGLRGGRRYIPYLSRHIRPCGAKLSSYHSTEECNQSSSDDSTQPPSPPPCVVPTYAPEPIQEPPPNTVEQSPTREQTAADAPMETEGT